MRAFWNRLRDRMHRDRLDAELAEELRFHRERLERDADGTARTSGERRALAARRLGNVTSTREAAREQWSLGWLDVLWQDVRYAIRGIRKSPGFALAVIMTLGLGVGANSAMFGVIDRLMFRPLPYLKDPATVNRVYLQYLDRGTPVISGTGIEYSRYLDLVHGTSKFAAFAAYTQFNEAVGVGDAAQERAVAPVSATLFDFFSARPVLGRFFTTAEDSLPRGAAVAVLGYNFWRQEYGGRNVVGQALQVGDIAATIIGVAPRGFAGVVDSAPPAVYIPITAYGASSVIGGTDASGFYKTYDWGWTMLIARRKPGVTEAQASADLSLAYRNSWEHQRALDPTLPAAAIAHPIAMASALRAGAGPDPGGQAQSAKWVFGVAVIVLLIACANVVNLFLVRATRRRRETAVRLALGVTRGRLTSQYITESLILALLAGLFGALIAQAGAAALRSFFGYDGVAPGFFADGRTLGVTIAIAIAIGLITGTATAGATEYGKLAVALRNGARAGARGRNRMSGTLLVVQGSLSVLLLIGAGLFVRSMQHVRTMRLGFDTDSVVVVVRHLHGSMLSDTESIASGQRLLAAAAALPGVTHATWVASVPFYSTSSVTLIVPGIDSVRRLGDFTYESATPDFFATMGTRILRGHAFGPADVAGAPRVAVVGEGMAKVLWPGADPIGKCMHINSDTMPCTTVIGVAEDAVQNSLTRGVQYHYYLPLAQFHPNRGFALFLRVHGDPDRQASAARQALQPMMPGQSYVTAMSLRSIIDEQRAPWRFGATMFTAFGILALIVAAIGLYGLIAYGVAQRMHELGVRIALGAQSAQVVQLVMSQGIAFALAGVLIGGATAIAGSGWIAPLLFEESPRDPLVYGTVGALLLLVAIVACAVPAIRASRADPNIALRAD